MAKHRKEDSGVVYTNVSMDRLHMSTGQFDENGFCRSDRCAIQTSEGFYLYNYLYKSRVEAGGPVSVEAAARWVATATPSNKKKH